MFRSSKVRAYKTDFLLFQPDKYSEAIPRLVYVSVISLSLKMGGEGGVLWYDGEEILPRGSYHSVEYGGGG